jgi:hypothetical protein
VSKDRVDLKQSFFAAEFVAGGTSGPVWQG